MADEQARKPSVSLSQISTADSHTAQDYIASQLQLEADAREALPYQFDTCTRPLGPLRQSLFACLTCNPPSPSSDHTYTSAGICYSCSISCHGEHTLVELFTKRNFVCDCGTTRLPSSAPCTLRHNEATGQKGGVTGENARKGNEYNHNFAGRFCACGETYDPAKEKGTMFQCLGLGSTAVGGCGEDWWHPECLMGLPRNANGVVKKEPTALHTIKEEAGQMGEDVSNTIDGASGLHDEMPLPAGFPAEDDFDHIICYKCVESNSWIKRYAGTPGFLPPLLRQSYKAGPADMANDSLSVPTAKRKAEDDAEQDLSSKRSRVEEPTSTHMRSSYAPPNATQDADGGVDHPQHSSLPPALSVAFSLFAKEDFRNHLCRCPECFPALSKHPQLLEEEDSYEPPMSDSDNEEANGGGSVGTGSLLERGEAALSTMDRMRAIEGVMAYNHLREKVKTFLKPFAESGQAVGAEDVKAYFAKLRGDEEAIRTAAAGADGEGGDNRREQSGY